MTRLHLVVTVVFGGLRAPAASVPMTQVDADVTRLLEEARQGVPDAADKLARAVSSGSARSPQELEALAPRQGRVVEMRFFAGLDIDQTAEVLSISRATVKRDWAFARAFLLQALVHRVLIGAPQRSMANTPLTPEQLERLKDAFERALELEADPREDFLRTFDADDADLGKRLRGLLDAHAQTRSALESPVSLDVPDDDDDDQWIGRRVGVYDITRRTGVGGMGAVYEAVRVNRCPLSAARQP